MIVGCLAYSGYAVALGKKPSLHWLSFLAVLVASAALASVPFVALEAALGYLIWPTTVTGWS